VKPIILLVEDDPGVRRVIARMLAEDGHEVLQAADGAAALGLVDTVGTSITLLLTDVGLPDMSGQTLARRITERVPDVRTLFVSGYPEDDVARRGSLPPGSALLHKPLTRALLLDAVRVMLDAAPPPPSRQGP
jgi:CheY-like chemotaxis protein